MCIAEYMEIYLFQVAPQIYLLSKLWNLLDRILHSWLVVKVSRREGRREKFETSDFFGAPTFCVFRSIPYSQIKVFTFRI